MYVPVLGIKARNLKIDFDNSGAQRRRVKQ